MNSKRKITLIICSLFAALTAQNALAERGKDAPGPNSDPQMEERMERLFDRLDLSAEQKEKLLKHKKAHRHEQKNLFEQLKEKKEELRTELDKSDADRSKVNLISNQIKELQGKLVDGRIEGVYEVKSILTPDQFKKLNQMNRKEWKEKSGKAGKNKQGKRNGNGPEMPDDCPPTK